MVSCDFPSHLKTSEHVNVYESSYDISSDLYIYFNCFIFIFSRCTLMNMFIFYFMIFPAHVLIKLIKYIFSKIKQLYRPKYKIAYRFFGLILF